MNRLDPDFWFGAACLFALLALWWQVRAVDVALTESRMQREAEFYARNVPAGDEWGR